MSIEGVNLFVGGGIGASQIKEINSWQISLPGRTLSGTAYKKNVISTSYALYAGIEKRWDDNLTFELVYARKHYGKTPKTESLIPTVSSGLKSLKAHNLSFGMRFNI